ncbi:MAG: TonB-dependent receptor [Bacteroidia bacterium]|nr:TonB-dependent receptor [Bacteroidia bacterium]
MNRATILLLFILINHVIYSQDLTQNIRGKVVDSQTEAPLFGAVLIIRNSDPVLGTRTDVDGNFVIEKVPVGRQTVEVSHIGYLSYAMENIFITSNKETYLNLKLEESVTSLSEVLITSKLKKDQPLNQNAAVSARTFSIEETEKYSGSIGDPARMASNFAGIATICDQRNDIVIRGNSPLGVLWRLDGIDIPNPNHFSSFGASGGPISILNNNLLTNSDFFTGAFPAEYGNALSGVFDLKMRSASNLKYEFVTQVGMNGFEIGAEGPIINNKSSFLINYRYSTLAIVDAMGFKVGIDAIPYYQDASFKITSNNTKFGKFSLIGIGGYSYDHEFDSKKDTSQLKNGSGEDFTFGSGMGSVGLIHKLLINNRINIENIISLSYTISHISEDNFTIQDPVPAIYYRQKSDEKGINFSTNIRYKPDPRNAFQAGISFQMLKFQFADSVKSGNDFIVNLDQKGTYDLLKSFVQWQHKFSDNLLVYSGFNFMLFTFNNKSSAEPRLGLKWSFNPRHSVNIGFGLHSQLIPRMFYVVESEINPGEYDPMNQKLGFSKSLHSVIGYNFLISENLRLKFETYFQHLYEIPVKKGNPVYSIINFGDSYFDQLPIIDSLVNKGTGKNYGIELTLEKFLDKGYYALFTGSLFESKYKGYDGIERNSAFNGNFILNTLAGKEFKIGKYNYLSLNFKVTYAGSLRYVPYDIEQIATDYYVRHFDWSRAYQDRRKDYFRLNGRFGYKLIKEKFSAELAIDFMNMTNHKDIFTEYFNSKTGEMEYSYQFPFLPIGFLRFQF